jgi:molybdate transport system substrate-binding protein
MRKHLLLLFIILCLITLNPAALIAAEPSLFLWCGAGLRQPVDEILKAFQKQTTISVKVEFGGSGKLLARYQATGQGDVFLPGSHFYVEKIVETGDVAIVAFPVALHTPVVAVNKKQVDKVKVFSDLAKPGIRVGLGDPKAMALGRTAEDVLNSSGIKQDILKNVVVRAATVKQLTMYLVKGDVDAAIIARADAFQNQDTLTMFEIDNTWYTPEIVKAAVLKSSQHPEQAQKLAEFISSPYGIETFGKYGFLPAK